MIPVFIINWNGLEDTLECINAALEMEYQDYCLYVLDNGSDNQEGAQLLEMYRDHPKVEIWLSEKNLGFTGGTLYMWDQVSSQDDLEYLALLNNDAVPQPDWLGSMVAFAKRQGVDMVSSRIVRYDTPSILDNIGHEFLNTGEVLPIGFGDVAENYSQVSNNWGSCAAATLYSVPMIREIGFFDSFFETGFEDAEFGVRARLSGYECRYLPEAIVHHKISKSVNKIKDAAYLRRIQANIFYSYLKLMPPLYLVFNAPFVGVKYAMALTINLIFGRWPFLKANLGGFWDVHWKYGRPAWQARRRFQSSGVRRMGWLEVYKESTFFILKDWRRLMNLINKR